MKVINLAVTVHTCLIRHSNITKKNLQSGERYISAGGEWYRPLPKKCHCRKKMQRFEANELITNGQAQLIWKLKSKKLEEDINKIWMFQQIKVPRIDLISKADVQRAYGLKNEDPNPTQRKFQEYIEEVHKLHLESRAQLIVPFRPDPMEGRVLFPFTADQRTPGGHEENK